MDDPNQPGPTANRPPIVAARPFARPERPADRLTPLGTRSVLFVPPQAREQAPATPAEGATVVSQPQVEAGAAAADIGAERDRVAAGVDHDSHAPSDDRTPTVEWTRTLEESPATSDSDAAAEGRAAAEGQSAEEPTAEVPTAEVPTAVGQGEGQYSGDEVTWTSRAELDTPRGGDDEAGKAASPGEPDDTIAPSADWSVATDYPPDDLGFPSVPPGYEFALDEAPREGGDVFPEEQHPRGQDSHLDEQSLMVASGADQAAETLEVLADLVRRGELRLPAGVPLDRPANVLAGLLVAVLGDATSPGKDH